MEEEQVPVDVDGQPLVQAGDQLDGGVLREEGVRKQLGPSYRFF